MFYNDYWCIQNLHPYIKEIILATSSTIAGQITANYLYKKLKDKDINITRLSRGLPVGGELDYLDDGTLGQAIEERVSISNKWSKWDHEKPEHYNSPW